MKQQNSKTPLVFRLGLILLCAMLCSCYLIGGLFARYTTSVTASSTARVAYAVADATGETISTDNLIDASQADAFEYRVTVTNTKDDRAAEVTLKYAIHILLPENFPNMNITVSDATKDDINSTATKLIFWADAYLPAGIATVKEHIVTLQSTSTTVGVYPELTINMKVIVEQID